MTDHCLYLKQNCNELNRTVSISQILESGESDLALDPPQILKSAGIRV